MVFLPSLTDRSHCLITFGSDLAGAHASNVRAGLEPIRFVEDDLRRVRAGRHDVGIAHDLFGRVDGHDFDIQFAGHLAGKSLAIGLGRTVNFDAPELAHFIERFQITARHAAGPEDADVAGIFARQIFRPQSRATADAHVLHRDRH